MSSGQQRRHTILTAAVEVFAERGYEGTSVDHLLAAMALDRGAFERRFADKQGCFLAVFDRTLAVADGHLIAALHGEQPWPERVAGGLWTVLELIDANPAAARLALIESHFAGEAALRRYMATLESLALFMRDGRECTGADERLPSILDSVLPGGVAFSLRCQLLRSGSARGLYSELLRLLLLPYLGEAETAACLSRSPAPAPTDR